MIPSSSSPDAESRSPKRRFEGWKALSLALGLSTMGCQSSPEKSRLDERIDETRMVVMVQIAPRQDPTPPPAETSDFFYAREALAALPEMKIREDYQALLPHQVQDFYQFSQNVLEDPQLTDEQRAYLESRLRSYQRRKARRARGRVELAYCARDPQHYEELKEQWENYLQEQFVRQMRFSCEFIYVKHREVFASDPQHVLLVSPDPQDSLVNQIAQLTRRLEMAEYQYLLSTMFTYPGTPEEQLLMQRWEHIVQRTEWELQDGLQRLVENGGLPAREPFPVPQ